MIYKDYKQDYYYFEFVKFFQKCLFTGIHDEVQRFLVSRPEDSWQIEIVRAMDRRCFFYAAVCSKCRQDA